METLRNKYKLRHKKAAVIKLITLFEFLLSVHFFKSFYDGLHTQSDLGQSEAIGIKSLTKL